MRYLLTHLLARANHKAREDFAFQWSDNQKEKDAKAKVWEEEFKKKPEELKADEKTSNRVDESDTNNPKIHVTEEEFNVVGQEKREGSVTPKTFY